MYRALSFLRIIPKSQLIKLDVFRSILFMILGVIVVVVGYTLGQIPLLQYASHLAESLGDDALDNFYSSGNLADVGMDNNLGFALMLTVFIVAITVFWIYVKSTYRLKFKDLITPFAKMRWGRVVWGFGLVLALTAISELLSYAMAPEYYRFTFDPKSFWVLILICLFMLPIQTSAEEIIIRGYLMPHLSHIGNKAIIGLLATSLFFAAIHMGNPEVKEHGVLLTFPYYFISALFLGLMTTLDDGLEMALGVHFGVNLFSASIMSYEAAVIPTQTIWESTETNPALVLVVSTVMTIVFLWLSAKRFDWPSWSILFDEIITDNDREEYNEYV